MRQRARQVTTTLILATALTFNAGCMKAPRGETLMGDKPKTPVVLRDAQEEVTLPRRTLDAVPVPTGKKDAEGEIKKEKFDYPHLRTKERKRTTPNLEFK